MSQQSDPSQASTRFVRPSALGTAEFCPLSTETSEHAGIGRSAILSSVWHAVMAGDSSRLEELRPDERDEVATWKSPDYLRIQLPIGHVTLEYSEAMKETPVKLYSRDELVTEGTADFHWVCSDGTPDSPKWLVVGDLKRNAWHIQDGPDCLQLAAYGHALAQACSCVGYTPVLWSATDGSWVTGQSVSLDSPEALDIWKRLKRASRNDYRISGEARGVTGAHCRHCYGRMRCKEWALMGNGDGLDDEITHDNAGDYILRAQAMAERAERALANGKAFAERDGAVVDKASRKVYLPVQRAGKQSLDKEALLKDYPDAAKYWRKGKPYEVFEWRAER